MISYLNKYYHHNDKIPFTDGNISILKGTEVYSNYLIHNKADFLENISKVEINKPNVAKDILELITYVENTVYEKFNKKIELEIEIMGEN